MAGVRGAAFPILVAGVVASAWAVLALWSASPYGRYLDHGRWSDLGFAAEWCRAVPAGGLLVPATFHAASWMLMIAAMMLPTTLPLLRLFRRITAERRDAPGLMMHVIAGYLCAWVAFGVAAHALDAWLVDTARGTSWFVTHGWIVGALVVGAAGAFQFSALKYRCLDKCRTPYGFIVERWHGKAPAREAFRIGLENGAFCVGCCWALMLLMFVVGMGNIGWMLALGALMAIEKNVPGGKRLSAPLGIALIAWAGAIVLANVLPVAA